MTNNWPTPLIAATMNLSSGRAFNSMLADGGVNLNLRLQNGQLTRKDFLSIREQADPSSPEELACLTLGWALFT